MINLNKFILAMANEFKKTNFQYTTRISDMVENATAYAVDGDNRAASNFLGDVVDSKNRVQYSVKSYKDNGILKYNTDDYEEPLYSPMIIERRVGGVDNLYGEAIDIYSEIIDNIINNEIKSYEHFDVDETKVLLLGYCEDEEYLYFRINICDYYFEMPSTAEIIEFTERSSNYGTSNNISSINGFNENGEIIYKWIHPNNQSHSRCLKKKYILNDSKYFKIRKESYTKPSDDELLKLIEVI